MAARRLLILMLAVLAVSTLAAALLAPAPEPERTETTTAETNQQDADQTPTASERLIEAELSASAKRPRTVRLRRGDQLSLLVRSSTGGQVEIPAFGLIDDVGRADPARFDLLAERSGKFVVRFARTGRVVGRIVVGRRGPDKPKEQKPES
jgi:hypothetical protein